MELPTLYNSAVVQLARKMRREAQLSILELRAAYYEIDYGPAKSALKMFEQASKEEKMLLQAWLNSRQSPIN